MQPGYAGEGVIVAMHAERNRRVLFDGQGR